jgi:uncharacterized repeat protein (TIGR04138 family)
MFAALIRHDLPCVCCGYNLRGLTTDLRCPECGALVRDTLETVPSGEMPDLDDVIASMRRERFEPIAKATGYSVDAVMFVHDAWRAASSVPSRRGPNITSREVNAKQICDAVRDLAFDYFNDSEEAKDLLGAWGLRSGEDVGRIIFGMIEVGWIRSRAGDSAEQFKGLFSLDALFGSSG